MIQNIRIRNILISSFLAVGIIPFALIGISALIQSSDIISEQAFDKLKVVQEIKRAQVEEYFQKCRTDIAVLSKNPTVTLALEKFSTTHNMDGTLREKPYQYFDEEFGFGEYIRDYHYYDLILIKKDGKIVYSAKMESDLGQNVVDGPLSDTALGKGFNDGMKGVIIQDFQPYHPSGDKHMFFFLGPIYQSLDTGEGKEVVGVVALKLDNDSLNQIANRRQGMGKTGETFLARQLNGKTAFLTDLVSGENETIDRIGQEISLSYLEKAFSGQSDSEVYDHQGEKQLVSYNPLTIEGLDWVLASKIDQAEAYKGVKVLERIMSIIAIVCITIILLVGLFLTRLIIQPIKVVVDRVTDISEGEGDLTVRLDDKGKNEMGELAKGFNKFIDKLQTMIRNIAGTADSLNKSSSDLSELSQQTSDGTGQVSSKVNMVAAAVEEMSSNMDSVAAAMEEASTNVNIVASSVEEMTSTINEIAQNSEKARSITGEAVSRAQKASGKVDELGNAAQDIGKVTETITEISEQTNLLALNATIEAARAGEAGKGFAVVANEIKELARQTADATQEIKQKIEGIQNSTAGTVSEIEQISKVIDEVNEIVTTIATAIEEQSVTTKEIANNVAYTSSGIQEVNENVSQSSAVSTEIAKDLSDINQATGEMSNSSAQINLSSKDLSQLAEELKQMVNKFKID
ncbi:MAG: methyl-accepting chemotaxis protein [Deltaproteobacteria bacterium]|nr:methyl-accepting chemotaxis protein [Deltaproteobacteria bacterium]